MQHGRSRETERKREDIRASIEAMKTANGEEGLKSEHPRAQGAAESSSAEEEEKERKR